MRRAAAEPALSFERARGRPEGAKPSAGGVAVVFFTSGSTGTPKPVRHTHAALLWSGALASSVTDNVPLAAVLAKILQTAQTASDSNLWWATVFGCNLGGNFTPIGSASTLVAVAVIHKNGLELGFVSFVRRAAPFAVLQLALASAYVLILL